MSNADDTPEAEPMFVAVRGRDGLIEVRGDMPCILCGLPVEPGTGAKAVPPLPALHTECIRRDMESQP